MAFQLSSTGISHHNLLPHIPLIRLSAVNSSPHPGIAPQSLTPAPSCCTFQGTSSLSRVCMAAARTVWLWFHLLLQISCFPLRLKCFFSDSDSCPDMGIRPLLQFPHLSRAGPVLLPLLFFPLVPSSCQVLCDSIYYFPLVRYSYPLSAGVLHALLCLKVYSWCIHGERCTPCRPTPLLSLNPQTFTFNYFSSLNKFYTMSIIILYSVFQFSIVLYTFFVFLLNHQIDIFCGYMIFHAMWLHSLV